MEYVAFKRELIGEIKDFFENWGESVQVQEHQMEKVNGSKESIGFRLEGSRVEVNMYPRNLYVGCETGNLTVNEIRDITVEAILNSGRVEQKATIFEQPEVFREYLKERAYLSVVNTKENVDFLKNIPHEGIPGTDLTGYVRLDVGKNTTLTMTNELLMAAGMTHSEAMNYAWKNTVSQKPVVRSMYDVLEQFLGKDEMDQTLSDSLEEDEGEMVIVSNERGAEGANMLYHTEALDQAAELLGCNNPVILPSSRHELIMVNPEALRMPTEELARTVKEINQMAVSREDKLSERIYRYDTERKTLQMADARGRFPELGKEELHLRLEKGMDYGR